MKKKLSVYLMLFSLSLLMFFPGININQQARVSVNATASYEGEQSPLEILWECLASGVGGMSASGMSEEEQHKTHEDEGHAISFILPGSCCLGQPDESFEVIKIYNLCLNKGYQFMVFAPPECSTFA